MQRRSHPARLNWQKKVEDLGLHIHTPNGVPYWDETASYVFTTKEVAEITNATDEVYRLLLAAGDEIAKNYIHDYGLPPWAVEMIQQTWENEPPALNYMRLDFGYDGKSPPKLFEVNPDTPGMVLETAAIQKDWQLDSDPQAGQFNGLRTALINRWKALKPQLPELVHFTSENDETGEDVMCASFMKEMAEEAGIETVALFLTDIGWSDQDTCFTDLDDRIITAMYKFCAWEFLGQSAYGENVGLNGDRTLWIEPIWKMLWTDKRVLAHLWRMFPDHPNLLPTGADPGEMKNYVRKPLLGRDSCNVSIIKDGQEVERTGGNYGDQASVFQLLHDLPNLGGGYPVIGSWMVGGQTVGMCVKEGALISGTNARFVPHIIQG